MCTMGPILIGDRMKRARALSRNFECPCLPIIYRFVCLVSLYHNVHIMGLFFQSSALAAPPCLARWPHRKPDLTLHSPLVVLSFLPSVASSAPPPPPLSRIRSVNISARVSDVRSQRVYNTSLWPPARGKTRGMGGTENS